MGLSSFESSRGGPWAAPRSPAPWEERRQAWTPSLLPYILGSSPSLLSSHAGTLSTNRDAGLLPAESLGQGRGRVVAGPEEMGTYSCLELAVDVEDRENCWQAAFQTNKGGGNREGSEAPESKAIKILSPWPAGDMGLWGWEASHK